MTPEQEHEYVDYVTARLPVLRRVAYFLCGDEHRGDDLVQQTMTSLYVHWLRARAMANLDGYVHRILVRAHLSERRLTWSSRVRLVGDVPLEQSRVPGGEVEDRAVVQAVLAQLPPRQRAVLVLRFLCDLPVDEVADLLGCSAGTVKSQTSHGLAGLRRRLGETALARME